MAHKPIWYIKEIPAELCDLAVKDFLELPAKDANMGKEGEVSNLEQRSTTVRFAPTGHWFGYLMQGVGYEANAACNWRFDITSHENVQFGEYGPSQHYDWHIDVFPLAISSTDRKISVVCLLSDPKEFEGGELEVKLYEDYKAPLKKGTVIAFPSMLQHRVTPVISGLRRSAVIWMAGPRFK
jgi:PKHD-type hydroxylase